MRLPTCPLVQQILPALARRWVGKAKLFSEDINVIKEPVLGTAPGSPVVLSPALEVGTAPYGPAPHTDPCSSPPWLGSCPASTLLCLRGPNSLFAR